jgi:PIN domain nuclease of toxin-antitoxin system
MDAWALIALINDEPAAGRVAEALAEGGASVCAINLGEVLYRQIRTIGRSRAGELIGALEASLDVIDADWKLVSAAAEIKARGGLSYPDAFCVATAQRLGAPLWTGDGEIVALSDEVEIVDLRA